MELDVPECLLEESNKPGKISHQLLLFITGNFSREREIGRGAFASVYKVFIFFFTSCTILIILCHTEVELHMSFLDKLQLCL